MSQFGSFDGRDNRKDIMALLARLGSGMGEERAARKRASFLKRLLALSKSGLAQGSLQIVPCCLTDCYFAFVAITGTLGVPIDEAARLLEREVQSQ